MKLVVFGDGNEPNCAICTTLLLEAGEYLAANGPSTGVMQMDYTSEFFAATIIVFRFEKHAL